MSVNEGVDTTRTRLTPGPQWLQWGMGLFWPFAGLHCLKHLLESVVTQNAQVGPYPWVGEGVVVLDGRGVRAVFVGSNRCRMARRVSVAAVGWYNGHSNQRRVCPRFAVPCEISRQGSEEPCLIFTV